MALATQCPHCHTKFRVAADQLKLRGGIVRCGACQSIFDGNAHLVALDALGRKDGAPADDVAAGGESAPAPVPAPALDGIRVDSPTDTPTDTLTDTQPDVLSERAEDVPDEVTGAGPLDAVAPEPEPEPEYAAQAMPEVEPAALAPPVHIESGRLEPSFALPESDAPAAAPARPAARDDVPFTALPMRASAASEPRLAGPVSGLPAAAAGSKRARALDARSRRSKLTPTRIDAPKLRVPDNDEPEFVKRSRRQERTGRNRRILMNAGIGVLLLALAVQALLGSRAVLAARYPAAKPLLGALCSAFGCRVGLPTQVENLAIETGELSPLGPATYSLNTLLRNQGTLVQTWPSIELELVDDNNKPLLRRVFGPADYLPPATVAAAQSAGFAARSEQPVRIDFTLAGPAPAGYHLFVFYP
jgi:predicted Zn finger-like uncharacterized protein